MRIDKKDLEASGLSLEEYIKAHPECLKQASPFQRMKWEEIDLDIKKINKNEVKKND